MSDTLVADSTAPPFAYASMTATVRDAGKTRHGCETTGSLRQRKRAVGQAPSTAGIRHGAIAGKPAANARRTRGFGLMLNG
jgi:hypothetical protein